MMHFEILVEDQSGKKVLDILVPNIIGDENTFNIHSYKGIGRLPKNLSDPADASKRILLNQLPKLLRGYGKAFAGYPPDYAAAVILVCDLDDKHLNTFRQELYNILNDCRPMPETRFCIAIEEGEAWFLGDIPAIKSAYPKAAIEEGEAWFLGDIPAIKSAYPKAKDAVLNAYVNDSICGTWECLAEAVYTGGSVALSAKGWQAVGAEKSQWAEKISPHMDVTNNASPSFAYFRQNLLELAGTPA